MKLKVGDAVVVDNGRDLNLGKVVYLKEDHKGRSLGRVIRRVGPEDQMLIRRNKIREEEAHQICLKQIEHHRLPMKLVRVVYLHGGNKAIFYFSADGRVDFRTLVRDLAQQLHVRIEMRQIGVRDESKMLGGIGICGQQLCCARFLHKFVPVSIKMAKNQNLALNPQKLSGTCGRLMCCLVYEERVYKEQRAKMPKHGSTIDTPKGSGRVINVDILRGRVKVFLEDGPTVFTLGQLSGEEPMEAPKPEPPPPPPPAARAAARAAPRDAGGKKPDSRGRPKRRRRRKPRSGDAKAPGADAAKQGEQKPQGQQAQGQKTASKDGGDGKSQNQKRRPRRRSRRRKPPAESSASSRPSGGPAKPTNRPPRSQNRPAQSPSGPAKPPRGPAKPSGS